MSVWFVSSPKVFSSRISGKVYGFVFIVMSPTTLDALEKGRWLRIQKETTILTLLCARVHATNELNLLPILSSFLPTCLSWIVCPFL